jgi:xanthine dehydrogenase iron-sulfur cluster and FAD-binding subunit A
MTNQVMPKWKIDTIEAAIQALQRDKVPITASRSATHRTFGIS